MSEQSSPPESTPPGLPEKPKRNRGLLTGIAVVVVLAVAAVVVFFATRGSDTADGRTTVRIGTTEASAEYWPTFKELAAQQNIDLQVVSFSDYTQANPALSQNRIDLNLFQHLLFLTNYNVANNDTLTPISSTYIVPLSLYSRKHNAVADIPAGGTIAIPNDPTNQARALLVLQKAKLITLKGGGNVLSTPAEIDKAASKVTVTPVDAAQTVASLPSVDGSVVNNNFALNGGLDPSKALFGDDPADPSAEPYINAIVARAADKDNPVYAKVAEIYKDSRVADKVKAESKGTAVLVNRPAADLTAIAGRLAGTIRAGRS
ncbi:MetQ/NlpA family ABC transporter substrate-binding protein [Kibdelosporangium phytohabitans]|uniref:Methionine ABC transporter substrate-binding protein n=1 Tax=Kibdelosporangium phytohabitans TaxID=860235 RepID=A0A0N9I9W5_9PSEU|nr:MetQ/NlpA family ABC transporter substrate-binding protein [Kibdelosporangium phytohabitans]ALG11813.1 methionine ABC transporter substrate-binding protein [Kibdelosporangium phytohabitans]MBE1463226.1 D-methionine transport system substrate-binding protein [Kibdelosporangium phytohabitans]